jgi:hypothetical protein
VEATEVLAMDYVIAGRQSGGGFWDFDPRPYVERLGDLAPRLPPGARAFATYPEHYDYDAPDRCTKDLRIESWELADIDSVDARLELSYGGPPGAPDVSRLTLEYTGVRRIEFASVDHGDADRHRLGHLLVDEVRPTPGGAAHELLFYSGGLTIECHDLVGRWRPQ